jgi:class 3 adenylate cyclase
MAEGHPRARRKLSAILMADVSGFSRMMGADEEGTTALIQQFLEGTRELIEHHEGRVVDTAGDSVFGEFDSVVNAVRCAHEIQTVQRARNAEREPAERMETRIGVHVGDVIVEDYRIYGDGVNVAARLEQQAEPGGILVSEAVYQQIRNKLDLKFVDLGVRELKNIAYPIRLYRVAFADEKAPARWRLSRPRAPALPPPRGAWLDEIGRTSTLVPGVVALALLGAPLFLFPTGGVLPTGGAVLLGSTLGGAWARSTGRRGWRLIGLGLGVAAGAPLTDWSQVSNALFVLGGAMLLAVGIGASRRSAP